MTTTNQLPEKTMPAAAELAPELSQRFLAAMLEAASAAQGDEALELRLRRLSPAPLGPRREGRFVHAMQHAAPTAYHRGWRYVQRWAAAAALFVISATGAFLFMNGSAVAASPASGIASRSVVESKAGGAVQWQEGQTAVRHYEVLYEDSFVLDAGEESTITVRVPNRTQVLVEDEVI